MFNYIVMLGTIMIDPVVLPISKVVMDRTTIARHLLRYVPLHRSSATNAPVHDISMHFLGYFKLQEKAGITVFS